MDIVSFMKWCEETDNQEAVAVVNRTVLNQVAAQGDGKAIEKALQPYMNMTSNNSNKKIVADPSESF